MEETKKESVIAEPKKVEEAMQKEAAQKINGMLSDEDKAKFEKVLEIAKMPVKVHDKDFKLGEREIDVRELSSKNKQQLSFRVDMLNSAYLLDISQSLTDIQRLLIAILRMLGVTNITEYLTDTIDSIEKEVKEKTKEK